MTQIVDNSDNDALIPLILAEQEAREESALLYKVSKAINQAVNLMDILQATKHLFSAPIDVGIFVWENYDRTNANYAEAIISTDLNLPPGVRMPRSQVMEATTLGAGEAIVINDVYAPEWANYAVAGSARMYGLQAFAASNLTLNQRVLGFLAIASYEKYHFTERETRLMSAVADLTAAALERFRLHNENEAARRNAETLASINSALLQASDEQAILAAVVVYAQRQGAQGALLNYYEYEIPTAPAQNIVMPSIAVWRQGEFRTFEHSWQLLKPPHPLNRQMILWNLQNPTTIKYIEDMTTFAGFTEADRQDWAETHQTRGIASLPLYSAGRFFGVLDLLWFEPHQFSDEEKFIYSQLLQTLPSVVASRRAFLAELEARQERELLFEASAGINGANTYDELVRAVKKLNLSEGDVNLILYKHPNFGRDGYYEIVAATNTVIMARDSRIRRESLAALERLHPTSTYVIEDVESDPKVDQANLAYLRSVGIRSILGFPMRFGERLLGTLSIVDAQVRHYSQQQRRLFETLGRLAVAAVERIRLQEGTALARQQAETLAYLNGKLLQATDEKSILKALVPYVEQQEADAMMLYYFDPQDPSNVAGMQQSETWRRGHEVPFESDTFPILPVHPIEEIFQNMLIQQSEMIHYSADVTTDPRFPEPDRVEWATSRSTRGWVILPLYSGGRAVGLLDILWFKPHGITDEEYHIYTQLLQTLPSVVGSRRAYLAELEAREEQEALFSASKAINAAMTFDDIARAVATLKFPSDDVHVVIFENYDFDKANKATVVGASYNAFGSQGHPIPLDPLFQKVRELAVYEIVAAEISPLGTTTAQNFQKYGIASGLMANLTFDNRWIGRIGLMDATRRTYTPQEKRLAAGVADLVAAAAERIRLQQETTAALERAEQLNEQIQKLAALEERNRLARELHDSVSQALYGIGLGTQTALAMWGRDQNIVKESLDYILTLSEAALVEMRTLIFELRPESLENEGLVIALSKQAASLQARHQIDVRLEMCDEPTLPLEVKESLYRVAREALHNVVKHAGASSVSLRMKCDERELHLDVIDDGVGFDTNGEFPGHLGLHSMRERMEQLNGRLRITSAPGKGAHLSIALPLTEQPDYE